MGSIDKLTKFMNGYSRRWLKKRAANRVLNGKQAFDKKKERRFLMFQESEKKKWRLSFGTAVFSILLLVEVWCFYFYVYDFNLIFTTATERHHYYLEILIYFSAATFLLWELCGALKTADQWEKAVVLRLGKFKGLKGPGFFFIIPIIDRVDKYIDQRVRVSSFSAEKTLTKDTVPVNVDAVTYWTVWDAEKTALEVQEYVDAVSYAAQICLRDIIGKHELADLLQNREKIAGDLQQTLDEQTNPWGITCQNVGIRDIVIPADLSDAMSKQAQAERERLARIILGTAETEISEKFEQASRHYRNNPVALQLRGMNMLFEGLKEKGSLIIVPSSALESMNLGAVSGLAALNEQATKEDEDKNQ